jgi:molybdopterin converting factor small subunit
MGADAKESCRSKQRDLRVIVRIPSALRTLTGGATQFDIEASTVAQALHALAKRFPALLPLLCDEAGHLRRKVNVYVNDEHVRYRQGEQTPLQDGDTVLVMPILMGG